MVKVIQLDTIYVDRNNVHRNVFMIEYSDVPYLKYGDMIFDQVDLKVTAKYIEEYINDICDDLSETLSEKKKEKKINNFVYRKDKDNGDSTYTYLKTIWRDLEINDILR